jgi:hypothetical protein
MKRIGLFLPLVLSAAACAQQGPQLAPGKTEVASVKGKVVGYSNVSPALQKEIEAKYGKKSAPNPNAKGPNAQVTNRGFVYVSPNQPPAKK